MAQRDYVKKSTRKKSKAKSSNKSRKIPNILVVLVSLLVILFVAILYFVSSNNSNKPTPPIKKITEKPQFTLPSKPEERWTYLKELEKAENHQLSIQQQQIKQQQNQERQQILDHFINDSANMMANPTTQLNNWILQCGAFKDKDNAETAKAKLAMFGVTATIINDKLYRVIVDGSYSKTEAESIKTRLESNGISDCILSPK